MPQNGDVPFWYRSVIESDLIGESYGASEDEIRSALSLLKKRSESKGELILPLHLKQFMQNKDIFNKKSSKFKIEIYERIRKYNHRIFAVDCRNSLGNGTVSS